MEGKSKLHAPLIPMQDGRLLEYFPLDTDRATRRQLVAGKLHVKTKLEDNGYGKAIGRITLKGKTYSKAPQYQLGDKLPSGGTVTELKIVKVSTHLKSFPCYGFAYSITDNA